MRTQDRCWRDCYCSPANQQWHILFPFQPHVHMFYVIDTLSRHFTAGRLWKLFHVACTS